MAQAMHVVVDGVCVGITTHAVDRYRGRVDRTARYPAIAEALVERGSLRRRPPAGVTNTVIADAWLVLRECVFPLVIEEAATADYVAVTCLKRHRLGKQDRRMIRDQQREDSDPWTLAS